MKKSLVALAALAASGAVLAQATLYGRTDIGYGVKASQLASGANNQKQTGVMDGGNAGSRIGFRGTEDLGGGMKAHFVTEQGISPTNGALFGVRTGTAGIQYDGLAAATGNDPGTGGAYTQGTNRQTYVGLEGGFGTVRVGYQYTTIYEISTLSGFTNTSEGVAGGSMAHLWGQGVAGGTRANAIKYISPRIGGGFLIALEMGSGTGREMTEFGSANSADQRTLNKQARNSLHLDYLAGPLRAAFGYTNYAVETSAQAAGSQVGVYGALTKDTTTAAAAATASNTNLSQLAASYDFGAIKLGANINSGSTNNTVANTTTNFASRAISFDMPMGKINLVGGFNNASQDSAGVVSADWASSQLGVKYNFSKRTILYGYTGTSTNNAATGTAFKTMTGTIVGIDHQF